MSLPIFFIEQIEQSDLLMLNEDTSRHVVQVLRMKEGEMLQLTDGKGNLLTVAIADAHKKKCMVVIKDRLFNEQENRQVSIGISLLKNVSRFEWFLEKATEIGVSDIIPLKCERTEKQYFRFDRMNNIVISAMLQSQQVWLPILHEPVLYNETVTASGFPIKLLAHCIDEKKCSILDIKGPKSVQILIGPEGDFSPAEIDVATAAGFLPVTLGNTRLRTETAGVVAAACLCL